MRYAVISKGLSLSQIEAEALRAGAKSVRKAELLGQVFCDLEEEQARRLAIVPGLVVKPVKRMELAQIAVPELGSADAPVVSVAPDIFFDTFFRLRQTFEPALSGVGLTVAVLDSGIRKSQASLRGKVCYEADFSDSSTTDDLFGHGTQVAFVVAGGRNGLGERAGVSPGASLMNIKVVGDDGLATDETIIRGIDRVCQLAEQAREAGLWPTEEMYPNVINLSLGGEDDGDSDNPVRVACRQAVLDYGLDVIAAAGNFGPTMTTIMLPACDPQVIAVGAIETSSDIVIWERSSRGPTVEGQTKPDFVLWGTGIEMASEKADDEYVTKSGTSFSTPMLSGLAGLLWESGRRAYGDLWLFRWTDARELALYFCTKPQDAAVKKDNTYGYGLPAMGTMLGRVSAVRTAEQEMMEAMSGMTMIAMMLGMMGGFI